MFYKVRFTSKKHGSTAGIVIQSSTGKFDVAKLSRNYPYREAMKMVRFERSPRYGSFDEAFAHNFEN